MDLKILKIRNVKLPTRGTNKSAGIDFYIPEFDDQFITDLKSKNPLLGTSAEVLINPQGSINYTSIINKNKKHIAISPHGSILIPSGIKANIPPNHVFIAFNKSGVATKTQLIVGACVIDEDYVNEIHINLINTSNNPIIINENQKIIQFLLMPIIYCSIEEETNENILYLNKISNRIGGFGSTGS